MSFVQWITILGCAALPAVAMAGAPHAFMAPAQASTRISAPVYTSVLQNYHAMQEEAALPDQLWQQANDNVARLGGHAGHIQSEATKTTTGPASEGGDPGGPRLHERRH